MVSRPAHFATSWLLLFQVDVSEGVWSATSTACSAAVGIRNNMREHDPECDELHSVQLLQLEMHLDHGSRTHMPMTAVSEFAENSIGEQLPKQATGASTENRTRQQYSRQPWVATPQVQPAHVLKATEHADWLKDRVNLLQLSRAAYAAISTSRLTGGTMAIMVLVFVLVGMVVFLLMLSLNEMGKADGPVTTKRSTPLQQPAPSRESSMPSRENSMLSARDGLASKPPAAQQPVSTGSKVGPPTAPRPGASSLAGGPPETGSTLERAFQMLRDRGTDLPPVPKLVDKGATASTTSPATAEAVSIETANSLTTTADMTPAPRRLVDPGASFAAPRRLVDPGASTSSSAQDPTGSANSLGTRIGL